MSNTENSGYIRGLYTAKGMLMQPGSYDQLMRRLLNALDQAQLIQQELEQDYLAPKERVIQVRACRSCDFHGISCLESEDSYMFFKSSNDVRPSQCTYIKKDSAEKLYELIRRGDEE